MKYSHHDVAGNVRRLRAERGWSQQALADAAGEDIRTVQRAESRRCSVALETAIVLADALGVSVDELVWAHDEVVVSRLLARGLSHTEAALLRFVAWYGQYPVPIEAKELARLTGSFEETCSVTTQLLEKWEACRGRASLIWDQEQLVFRMTEDLACEIIHALDGCPHDS